MTSKKVAFAVLIVVLGMIGLGSVIADSKMKREVTFSKDVAPIFFSKCADCHRPNDIAPMALISYKDARPWARSIKEKVLAREMPPWSPDPRFGEFTNDCRLSQSDIDTITAWVDQGAKEGNPKDLPAAPQSLTGGWQIGKPDITLQIPEEWTVKPGDPDNYINFFVPTNFTEDTWVQAAEIQPGNRKIVHHVIAFVVTPQAMAKRKEAEAQGRRIGASSVMYIDGTLRRTKMDAAVVDDACKADGASRTRQGGGGDGAEGALLAGYAPGKGIDVLPAGTAKKVPAGSTIMFQVHYSAFAGSLEKPEKDRTRMGLVLAKEPPDKMLITSAVANTMFKIPAGAGSHEVTACMTVPVDLEVVTYMPHMHLRGKDMKYEAIYPDGRRETLLWVPKFSFSWQTMYYLKKPISVPKGTRIIVTAHFDNSTKNKYNPDPAKDVRWGDPTYDEMMIGWFDIVVPNPAKMLKPAPARAASESK